MTESSLFAFGSCVIFVFLVGCYLTVRRALDRPGKADFEMQPILGTLPHRQAEHHGGFGHRVRSLRTKAVSTLE